MNKIQTFLYVLKNSVSSSKYYNDILKTNIQFSIKYFIALSFIASVIFTTAVSINIIPNTLAGIRSFVDEIGEIYPGDLVIEFKDGMWEINKEEPLYIKMPKLPADSFANVPENLIVFDKNGTIDKLGDYNTVILLNSENMIQVNGNQVVSTQPIKAIPNVKIDKGLIDSRLSEMGKVIGALPYILPLLILLFVFAINYILPGVFNILIIGLGLFIVSMVMKKNMRYESALKIGIHSMTIPMLIQALIMFIPNMNLVVPGWLLLTSFGIGIYFLSKVDTQSEVKKIEE